MAFDLAQERQHAHAYLDCLPGHQVAALRTLLESMLSPMDRLLAQAPKDDEPVTEADRIAIQAGIDSLKQDGGISTEDILADFGLTKTEFDQFPLEPISQDRNGNG